MDLLLVKFASQDFADYFRLVSDARVMAMITERAIPEDEARRDYQRLLINDKAHPDAGHFRILNADSGEFIGLGKLELAADSSDTAEVGYMILPAFWGKGIASHVAKLLVAQAQALPPLRCLVAIIDPANLPSRKVLTNNGFVSREFKTFDGLPGEVLELTW